MTMHESTEKLMVRSFIDEKIKVLSSSAEEIQKTWNDFKSGKLSKSEFEDQYYHVFGDWLDDFKEHPNNGCKYMETNPECEYFIKMNI